MKVQDRRMLNDEMRAMANLLHTLGFTDAGRALHHAAAEVWESRIPAEMEDPTATRNANTITINAMIEQAAGLASETGENPEYDRALVELIAQFMPGDTDHCRTYLEPLITRKQMTP